MEGTETVEPQILVDLVLPDTTAPDVIRITVTCAVQNVRLVNHRQLGRLIMKPNVQHVQLVNIHSEARLVSCVTKAMARQAITLQ